MAKPTPKRGGRQETAQETLASVAQHMPAELEQVTQEKKVDLVLEGGGVWGAALVGALCELEERGYVHENIAGTSAGAITAALAAAGYRGSEIHDIMFKENFASFADETWQAAALPLVGMPISVLAELGIHKGDVLLHLIRQFLADKDVHTFSDLVRPDFAADSIYRYKLQVIASDITARSMLVLPREAHMLGVEPDDLDVALAVRMSMSIPIFFEPVRVHNPQSKQVHLITDGGMLSNFPVWLFDSDGVPAWPTFGLRLVASDPKASLAASLPSSRPPQHGPGMVMDFLSSLVQTMMEAHDRMYLEQDTFVRTITIPTLGIGATDFNLTSDQLSALYESGRAAAAQFLQTWDFAAYIAQYRSGKVQPTRRELTVQQLRQTMKGAMKGLRATKMAVPTEP
jgi:NTE family protein